MPFVIYHCCSHNSCTVIFLFKVLYALSLKLLIYIETLYSNQEITISMSVICVISVQKLKAIQCSEYDICMLMCHDVTTNIVFKHDSKTLIISCF